MKFMVCLHGEPLQEVPTLVAGYMLIRDEFKKRWPRAFYGPQEAAAHGLTLIGKPQLTPHEAAAMRTGVELPGDRPEHMHQALRKGNL